MKSLSAGDTPVTTTRGRARLGTAATGAFALSLLASTSAFAVEGNLGEVNLQIDPTITVGASMRVSPRDCVNVGTGNGGCGWRSDNQDNGNLNFDRGDLIGANVKAIADMSATWENFGAFVRARAFYDLIYTNNRLRFRDLNHDAQQRLNSNVDILDAYAYWNSEVADMPFSLRVGNMVQNWGESLFIRNGINQFVSLDVASIRQAGSEVKEALQPMPMVYGSLGVTGLLTLEGFWQFGHSFTEPDPAGSFFQVDDLIGPGALPLILAGPDAPNGTALPPYPLAIYQTDDRNESNPLSQFGLSARYYATWLNQGTDLGLYYVHYNSRSLFLNFYLQEDGTPYYRYFYPGNINLFGASFNTSLAGSALSGEISYIPDGPMGVNTADQLYQMPAYGGGLLTTLDGITNGEATTGVIESDLIQGQLGTITQFNTSHPVVKAIDADVMTLVVNPGFVWAPNAGDGKPVNRSGAERGGYYTATATGLVETGTVYADQFSWGYRLSLSANYNNVLNTPWTLTPSIAWSHDVMGNSPNTITAGFQENTKQYTLGLEGDYRNLWKVNLSFTSYLGNPDRNQNLDKDFVAFSVSRAF